MSLVLLAALSAKTALLYQVIGFALLGLILWKFGGLLGGLLGIPKFGDRTKEIEQTFQKIERETTEITKQLAEYKQKIADLDNEAQRRLKAAVDEANRAKEQSLAEAAAQAQAILEKGRREIQIEREKAVLELRQETTRLTLEAADHLIQATMNDQHQERLVQTYLTNLDGVKKP